jgi:hypothetical protein
MFDGFGNGNGKGLLGRACISWQVVLSTPRELLEYCSII